MSKEYSLSEMGELEFSKDLSYKQVLKYVNSIEDISEFVQNSSKVIDFI